MKKNKNNITEMNTQGEDNGNFKKREQRERTGKGAIFVTKKR